MIPQGTVACWLLLSIFLISMTSRSYVVGSTCRVHPDNVVAAVGEIVSLTCSAGSGFQVSSWQKGKDYNGKKVVYKAIVYGPDGSIRSPKFVADGYAVENPKSNQTILHINVTSLSQAGQYFCTCSDEQASTGLGAVTVIETNFSTNSSIQPVCDGESVTFTCNISSSENIHYGLTIRDALANTVATMRNSSACKDPTTCQLNFTFIANASTIEQPFTCSINVTTEKSLRFSKVLNASVVFVDSTDCRSKAESKTGEKDGYRIEIIVGCCVLLSVVLTGIASFCLFRYRKRIFYKR